MTGGLFNKSLRSLWVVVFIVFTSAILSASTAYAALDNPLDWLTRSIDPNREHNVAAISAWHARIMVLAWGVLLPLGVVIARFFKVWPGQNWPQELDRREWWRGHLILQWSGAIIALAGVLLMLIWSDSDTYESDSFWHRLFGWITLSCLLIQVIGGLVRGSTGGPTYPAADGSMRGDHYDMTTRRKVFEHIHKSIGYLALLSGCIAIVAGLWVLNAPRWMWIIILGWWFILIICVAIFQRKGLAIDTYQAIWGPDSCHPGNRHDAVKSEGSRQTD